jgi:hypothetical protein
VINLSAIDADFLTRFLFAFVAYWLWGLWSEGVGKRIQEHYGLLIFGLFNRRLQRLKKEALASCSQIDDLLINPVANVGQSLNAIVNRQDLSPSDLAIYQTEIDTAYKPSILSRKMGQ